MFSHGSERKTVAEKYGGGVYISMFSHGSERQEDEDNQHAMVYISMFPHGSERCLRMGLANN